MDYATGAAQVTLQALPDPDSALIASHKTQSDTEVTIPASSHKGSITLGKFEVRYKTEDFEGGGLIAKAQTNSLSHVPHMETVAAQEMTAGLRCSM